MAASVSSLSLAISRIEHDSVLEPAVALAAQGHPLQWIEANPLGQIETESLESALQNGTKLVSVIWANNETGAIQPIADIAEAARAAGAWIHTDAGQAGGKIALSFKQSGVHLLSLSGHKIYGPKGVGALIAARGLPLQPQLLGGGQEGGLRHGTENVAGIVGLGAAAALARQHQERWATEQLALREQLEAGLQQLPGAVLFSAEAARVSNTVYCGIDGFDSETLALTLDDADIAVSAGAACAKGREPSHVLVAMGVAPELARSAIRISVGKETTCDDIDLFLHTLYNKLDSLRTLVRAATA